MGGIDLDPASSDAANERIGAVAYYTEDDNGLIQPWHGRVWMNPPYAQPLVRQVSAPAWPGSSPPSTSGRCVLVNNGTETNWFQEVAAQSSATCLPRGRVKFWHPEKESVPLQGQVVISPRPARGRVQARVPAVRVRGGHVMADIRDWGRFIRGRWEWTRFGYETGFKRGCQFTDRDAAIEFDVHRLVIETKQNDGFGAFNYPDTGQLLFLRDEAALGKTVIVLYGLRGLRRPVVVPLTSGGTRAKIAGLTGAAWRRTNGGNC